MGLSPCDFLRFTEILKVFMIRPYFHCMFSPEEEGTAAFKPKYDCGQFLVMGIIVPFGI
jgi:hypothetical protein